MANKEEHYYYVDPGIGSKRPGCPYTFFKDGHDIRIYIEPPRGYELTDFKYEPYESDDFYDGKIIAQYRKLPFFIRLTKKPLLLLFIVLGIIGICFGLSHYFDTQSELPIIPPMQNAKTAINVLPIDTTNQTQVSDTSMLADTIVSDSVFEEPVKEEITEREVSKEEKTPTAGIVQVENTVEQELERTIEQGQKDNGDEIALKPNIVANTIQESQPTVALTKEQFKQEFWDLIHRKESHMHTYSAFYKKYKDENLKSKEFFYLYLTILKDASAFEVWKAKLLRIPDDELKSIGTISALEQKIAEYE